MNENIGNFFITLPENMDVQLTSDDEDYILANLDLFQLQPININEDELQQKVYNLPNQLKMSSLTLLQISKLYHKRMLRLLNR